MPTAAQASEALIRNRRRPGASRADDPVNTSGENDELGEETQKQEAAEVEEEAPKAREPMGGVHWSESNTKEIQRRRKERYGY